ncbi:MAG: carbohydrate ABC transporter permease [Clostridia bacterium]|nr:carbohydrate ABC transporter permease [Clostridia bacterium]
MKTKIGNLIWHALLIIVVLFFFYPLIYMVCTSFKSLSQIFEAGLKLLPTAFTMENYQRVFEQLPVINYIGNSVIVASIVMVFKIVTSVLAAYALVFMDNKYANKLFYFFTLTMFIPFSVIMLPNYITLSRLGLINNLLGVALPQFADAMGIFRIRQAMKNVPKSLVEAARLDNVSHFQAMVRIVLPLVRPAVVAMCIFFFVNSWNEYFWPMLILRRNELYTVTLSMQEFISAEGGIAWGSSVALATIATLPPLFLYLFAQRSIISTFMSSGIKE